MFGHFKKNYALTLAYLISTVLSLILAAEHSFRAASIKANNVKKHLHTFCSSLWIGLMFLFGTEALQAFINESVDAKKEQKEKQTNEPEISFAESDDVPDPDFEIQFPKR